MSAFRLPRARLAVAALALALAHTPLWAVEIGVASSVKNDVTGDLAGQVRRLASGSEINQNETVATGDASATQLVFRDQTSLTLGENASLTLTRLIYDPSTKVGDVAARVGKGAFRFVSGVAQPGGYTLESPKSTIGVRGSIVEGYVDVFTGMEVYVLVEGAMEVCTLVGRCVRVATPGDYVIIGPDGEISGPRPWRGPILDLDASVNFVRTAVGDALFDGVDPLPFPRDANETLDGLRLDQRFPLEEIPEPIFEEECEDEVC